MKRRPTGDCLGVRLWGSHLHVRIEPENLEPEELQAILAGTTTRFGTYQIGEGKTFYHSIRARYPHAGLCCINRVIFLTCNAAVEGSKGGNPYASGWVRVLAEPIRVYCNQARPP